jgi:HD-GYP domain-containing protein (c-di-GMP phosphodiesterase class II)
MSMDQTVRMSEVIGALSYALDMTEGQPPGHCLRACWIGVQIGQKFKLSADEISDLYYTLLLKDAGCSSNAARLFQLYGCDDMSAKNEFKTVDTNRIMQVARFVLTHSCQTGPFPIKLKRLLRLLLKGEKLAVEMFETRCTRGSEIAMELGFSTNVAKGIRCLDEHFDGRGKPSGLTGNDIPLYSRIALLAQVIDVFHIIEGREAVIQEIERRTGSWHDPEVVQAFLDVAQSDHFWSTLKGHGMQDLIKEIEPKDRVIFVDDDRLDSISKAFARVIDAKSSFTFGHSTRVAFYADQVAAQLGFSAEKRRWLNRASLLHDIGKLGVSNAVLDKPDKLNDKEYDAMKLHPKFTEEILSRISIFKELAVVAGAHHERLDGKGYHKGLKGDEISLESRVITVADIYDALTADRPYRKAMPVEKALSILEEGRGTSVDGQCLDALRKIIE